MNWKEYKNWLDDDIITQTGESGNITFKDGVLETYKIKDLVSGETKFLAELNNFYRSLEATLDNEEKFHHLPTYQTNKTWEQLFPILNEVHFGAETNSEHLEKDIYDKLWEIYENWQQDQEFDSLYQEAKDSVLKEQMEELMSLSFLTNIPAEKRKKMLTKWEKWLSKYKALSEEKQVQLKDEKEEVEKMISILKDSQKEETQPENSWDWKIIGQNVFTGLVVVTGVWLILNFLKKEK